MAMTIARSLCGSSMLNRVSLVRAMQGTQMHAARTVTIRATPRPAEVHEGHDEKNMRLKRPLSPHLTIYKFQITSVLSITHRFTGLALTGYATVLAAGALMLPHDISHYISLIEAMQLSAPTLFAAKYVLAFPATYHTVNGVRHLFWDLGRFLTIKEVYTTGYTMLGISTILAGILSAM